MTASGLRIRPRFLPALVLALVAVGSAPALAAPAEPAPPEAAQMILHMLDYVGVDYPQTVRDGRVVNQGEYEEQVEFSTQARDMLGKLPSRPETPALLALAGNLIDRIHERRPGPEVSALTGELSWALIRAYRVPIVPRRPPDGAEAPALYATHCAACHGTAGHGDGVAARALTPRPSDFTDRQRMDRRAAYGLYSTITLGVEGTPMRGFRELPEGARWALALWVSGFSATPAERAHGETLWAEGKGRTLFPDLASILTTTRAEATARGGEDGANLLAFLRTRPALLGGAGESPIARSERLVAESLAAYQRGDADAARRLAISGYLEGFELVEAPLDTLDRGLRERVEAEFGRYRSLVEAGAAGPEVARQAGRVRDLLGEAEDRLAGTTLSPGTALGGALVILLREGLEALLVVAAMLAFLVRADRRDALPYVHAGWVAALVLGLLTWVAASYAIDISGASREMLEGVTALLAAVILLYVGFWMHDKAYTARWRHYIETRLRGALSGTTLWALASVSFLAVYREAFETVLFTQALWIQAGAQGRTGVVVGLAVAAVALVVIGWLVLQLGVRLPLGWVFGGGSAVLALLAVVLGGKGIAALQEAGALPVDTVDLPSVPLLGIYPTVQTLAFQVVLVIAIFGLFAWARRTARRTA